ncbi:hypothetical protein J6590_089208 [Homalodisca vitripennis]|nr:hypothetical protein J6590_089208 [Homalodisca vitripennis]
MHRCYGRSPVHACIPRRVKLRPGLRKTGLIFVLRRRRNGWTKWRHLKSVGLRHRKTSATKVEEVNTTITRDLGTNAVSTLRALTGACGQHASENGSVKSRLGQLQDPSAVGRHKCVDSFDVATSREIAEDPAEEGMPSVLNEWRNGLVTRNQTGLATPGQYRLVGIMRPRLSAHPMY